VAAVEGIADGECVRRKMQKDRLGRPLKAQVRKFRKQFKNAKPPGDDILAMFFHKVAQSHMRTKFLLKNGF